MEFAAQDECFPRRTEFEAPNVVAAQLRVDMRVIFVQVVDGLIHQANCGENLFSFSRAFGEAITNPHRAVN